MCSFVQYQAKSMQDAESLGSVAVVFLVGEQGDSRHQVVLEYEALQHGDIIQEQTSCTMF